MQFMEFLGKFGDNYMFRDRGTHLTYAYDREDLERLIDEDEDILDRLEPGWIVAFEDE